LYSGSLYPAAGKKIIGLGLPAEKRHEKSLQKQSRLLFFGLMRELNPTEYLC